MAMEEVEMDISETAFPQGLLLSLHLPSSFTLRKYFTTLPGKPLYTSPCSKGSHSRMEQRQEERAYTSQFSSSSLY